MNWDAVSAIAEAAGVIVAIIAIYLGYKKSPQIMERLSQSFEDQKKLAQAEAQVVAEDNRAQGNRDVILEHDLNGLTKIRNRATIRQGRSDIEVVRAQGAVGGGGKGFTRRIPRN
jgi:Sec-independent protein translocase protein TatA